MSRRRPLLIPLLVMVASLVGTSVAGAATTTADPDSPPPPFFGPTNCTGGPVAPGSYVRLTITGSCSIAQAKVVVLGDLNIAENASLNAVSEAQLVVKGSVMVGRHAVFDLGCNQEVGCATPTADRIGGDLTSVDGLAVIVHSSLISGTVSLFGGGGGVNCNSVPALNGPAYSDFEDNVLSGTVVVDSLRSCWFGFIRNHVGATVSITNNRFFLPDATEVVTNNIFGNLNCLNNIPQAQVGDSGGMPNTVSGHKRGECASL